MQSIQTDFTNTCCTIPLPLALYTYTYACIGHKMISPASFQIYPSMNMSLRNRQSLCVLAIKLDRDSFTYSATPLLWISSLPRPVLSPCQVVFILPTNIPHSHRLVLIGPAQVTPRGCQLLPLFPLFVSLTLWIGNHLAEGGYADKALSQTSGKTYLVGLCPLLPILASYPTFSVGVFPCICLDSSRRWTTELFPLALIFQILAQGKEELEISAHIKAWKGGLP